MLNNKTLAIQLTVWLGLWLVFALGFGYENKPAFDYAIDTWRVIAIAAFYNIFYYALLPFYFKSLRQKFFLWAPLAFMVYLSLMVITDLMIYQYKFPQKEISNRRILFMVMPPLFFGLVTAGAGASIRGFREFETKKKEEEEANKKRLEAELNLLKSQINPHFLLNTLNNLYGLAITEPEKTPEALLKLSTLVKYLLYECNAPKVKLSSEVNFILNYIDLQKLRLSSINHLQLNFPDAIPSDVWIEPMILLPFIENAFKHGISGKKEGTIEIKLELEDGQLTLLVKNQQLRHLENMNPTGIGLNNTQQRLHFSYPNQHSLNITDDGDSYQIHLSVNLVG
ncbi:MAG: sensor histidine kinase [Saprospiraceae bacterium]